MRSPPHSYGEEPRKGGGGYDPSDADYRATSPMTGEEE